MMSLLLTLQTVAVVFFTAGAWLFYGLHRLLSKRGYPISVFANRGNCWTCYRDLLAKLPEREQRLLKLRRACMFACFAVAGLLLLAMPFVPPQP